MIKQMFSVENENKRRKNMVNLFNVVELIGNKYRPVDDR